MTKDQVMSAARSVVKIVGAALVAHGMTKSATIVNGEDVIGVVLVIAGLFWSYYNHKDTTPS